MPVGLALGSVQRLGIEGRDRNNNSGSKLSVTVKVTLSETGRVFKALCRMQSKITMLLSGTSELGLL